MSENYPESQLSKENFVGIQWAVGRLVDELPEEGFIPRLVDSYWAKGADMVYLEETKDWLVSRVSTLEVWKGSRLKVVGLDALLTYKRGWPGLRALWRTQRYLLRLRKLNRGVDTGQWRVYERMEEPNGVCLVLSIDTASVAVLEGLKWRPFSGVGQAVSLPGAKPGGRSRKERGGGRSGGG